MALMLAFKMLFIQRGGSTQTSGNKSPSQIMW